MQKTKIRPCFQFWGLGTPKYKSKGVQIFFALKIFLGYPILGLLTPKTTKKWFLSKKMQPKTMFEFCPKIPLQIS